MKTRSRVNRKVDKKIFSKTANRTNVRNIPGHITRRGGQVL